MTVTALHEGKAPMVHWGLSLTTAGKVGMDSNRSGFVCQTKEFGLFFVGHASRD